ncbi:MAG TPA: hypothetical protein VMF89_24550, partial [Polyangiales bacterium]|nr:hypothetical protein [Polyangiales bacterium]
MPCSQLGLASCSERGVSKSHFFQLDLHNAIEDGVALLLGRELARAALRSEHAEQPNPCARARHRVNLTRIGGDNERTAAPRALRAGLKRVRNAQAIAAAPKPYPGSETTLARS